MVTSRHINLVHPVTTGPLELEKSDGVRLTPGTPGPLDRQGCTTLRKRSRLGPVDETYNHDGLKVIGPWERSVLQEGPRLNVTFN